MPNYDMTIHTDKTGKRWYLWKQKASGFNKWAFCPVGGDHTHPLADASPTKRDAISTIEWSAETTSKKTN